MNILFFPVIPLWLSIWLIEHNSVLKHPILVSHYLSLGKKVKQQQQPPPKQTNKQKNKKKPKTHTNTKRDKKDIFSWSQAQTLTKEASIAINIGHGFSEMGTMDLN